MNKWPDKAIKVEVEFYPDGKGGYIGSVTGFWRYGGSSILVKLDTFSDDVAALAIIKGIDRLVEMAKDFNVYEPK